MDYHRIHRISTPLLRVTPQAVADVEQYLNTTMPVGYQEYITTLGVGILNDTLRVYAPARIKDEYRVVQARWEAYWFWDAGRDQLRKERALEAIIIADTSNGDDILFHPDDPHRVYLLPHDEETIFVIGETFDAAVDWILHWDALFLNEDGQVELPEHIFFEPFVVDAS